MAGKKTQQKPKSKASGGERPKKAPQVLSDEALKGVAGGAASKGACDGSVRPNPSGTQANPMLKYEGTARGGTTSSR